MGLVSHDQRGPRVFRLRVVLKTTRAVRLHPHQAGLLYAVVAEANGLALKISPALPDGLTVEAVEQCRCRVAPFETYAFGLTLLASSADEAHQRVRHLRRGLIELGHRAPSGRAVFCGNFSLQEINDLVTDRKLFDDNPPTPVSDEAIVDEWVRLKQATRLTIRFTTPLRMAGSKQGLAGRPAYFDRHSFDPAILIRRLQGRLDKLGFTRSAAYASTRSSVPSGVPVVEGNHLLWLEVAYGGADQTRLGGAVGDLLLAGLSSDQIATLVWGQYIGIGENTRFGHGRYRIAQLGTDPYACPRSTSLRELAFGPQFLDAAAERYNLEPGRAGALLRQIRAGSYQPADPIVIPIRTAGKERRLAIPPREDRTLQRAVLDFLSPALDRLFESGSLAYRPGRGRHEAPHHLQRAFADGYRWALRADFTDFFNSVPHEELQRRLHACIADAPLVGLLMTWVRSGAPFPDQGLPTGAVLSPLLANLFLDEFDEAIGQIDARLIRYADDFVILFREQAAAEAIYRAAEVAAEELRLQLNAAKTDLVSLSEPFEWLGFRFSVGDEWEAKPVGTVRPTDQLGWHDTARTPKTPGPINLPGETEESSPSTRSLVLIGPQVQWLDVRDDLLRCGRTGSETSATEVPWERVEQLVCLGYPSPSTAALRQISKSGVPVVLASSSGAGDIWISSGVLEDAELVQAQSRCRADAGWRLDLAVGLVIAKLSNYAALAEACPERKAKGDTAAHLRDLAHRAGRVESLEQLLGLEGAGAAAWYRTFAQRASSAFDFPGRRAPRADDPLNILLNIGFTTLHRLMTLTLQQQGFAASVGILHDPRRWHAALASDIQELFRHLVDRAVIEISHQLTPASFQRDGKGPYPLTIAHTAHKQFRIALHTAWQRYSRSLTRTTPQPYVQHFVSQARSLRRHLLDRDVPYIPFVHPWPNEIDR